MQLEEVQQEAILDALEDADRVAVEHALSYPEYSAGRLMQREVVMAPEHWNVGQAIDHLRATPEEDLPAQFYHIVMVDPLRAGHEATHHPGEAVLRMADIVVVAKTNSAAAADVQTVIDNVSVIAPAATFVRAASDVRLDDPAQVTGRRVLVVDDGPTITHGGMSYGAGYVAAVEAGAGAIADPRASAVGELKHVFARYEHIDKVLPAMGYSAAQLDDLAATINNANADVVVAGTPSDLSRLMKLNKPVVRARSDFREVGKPKLSDLVDMFLEEQSLA